MKKLFLTTALVFPLAITPVLAQQAVVPAPGQTTQNDSAVTDPAADTTTGTEAAGDAADAASDAATDAADAAGDAATEAAGDAADAATDAADAAGDAATDAADAAGDAAADADAAAGDAAMEAEEAADAAADAAMEADAAADEAAAVAPDPDKVVQEQAANELRLDWVTGATVTSPDGETIGKVSDLIMDRDSGQMVAAVIGVGGFLGIGEKKIAVPWARLTVDYDANQITSDLSRAEADAAPEYVFREREAMPAPVDAGMPPAAPAPIQ